MTRLITAFLVIVVLVAPAFAAEGPDIRIIDNKISIQVDAIPLNRLLRLLDLATGMTSKVPPEFANRNMTVQFSNLDVNAAVHKIFEGQMLDYVFIDGQGIMVTAASQNPANATATAPPFPREPSPFESGPGFPPAQPVFVQDPSAIPFGAPGAVQGGAPGQNPFVNNQAQPAVIQTPFGPIPNPRLNQQQNQQQYNNTVMPTPGSAFGVVAPFGGATGFGLQTTPQTAAPAGGSAVAPITPAPLVPSQQPATKP